MCRIQFFIPKNFACNFVEQSASHLCQSTNSQTTPCSQFVPFFLACIRCKTTWKVFHFFSVKCISLLNWKLWKKSFERISSWLYWLFLVLSMLEKRKSFNNPSLLCTGKVPEKYNRFFIVCKQFYSRFKNLFFIIFSFDLMI